MGQNNTYNSAQLNQRINELEAKVKAADVEANPTGEATEALEKLAIDGDIYFIPAEVTANPTGEITNDLTGLQIGSDKYKIDIPVITRKTYSVTTVTNALVSPYGAFVQVQLSSDISQFGEPISVVSCSPSTNPVAACFNEGKNSCNIYSATAATFDITVTYSSKVTII